MHAAHALHAAHCRRRVLWLSPAAKGWNEQMSAVADGRRSTVVAPVAPVVARRVGPDAVGRTTAWSDWWEELMAAGRLGARPMRSARGVLERAWSILE